MSHLGLNLLVSLVYCITPFFSDPLVSPPYVQASCLQGRNNCLFSTPQRFLWHLLCFGPLHNLWDKRKGPVLSPFCPAFKDRIKMQKIDGCEHSRCMYLQLAKQELHKMLRALLNDFNFVVCLKVKLSLSGSSMVLSF